MSSAVGAAGDQLAPDQLAPDQLAPDQLVPDQLVPDQPVRERVVRPRLPIRIPAILVLVQRERPQLYEARFLRRLVHGGSLTVVLGVAAFLRLWRLDQVGYNSDEAVYAGTAASMAGHTELAGMFPVFRAHPLLFQTFLSLFYRHDISEWQGRALAAAAGIVTVGFTFAVATRMYGQLCGFVAGLLLAVMPYAVVVSRQVLLDGPMTMFATITLYCLVRYCQDTHWRWLAAAGAMLGATVLSKETSIVLLGSGYAFFALTPAIRIRIRHLLPALTLMGLLVAVFPLVLKYSGRSSTGQNYFLWQLSRRSNHPTFFYLDVLPAALGVLVMIAAVAGLVLIRNRWQSWRERLLMAWIAVPVAFFTIWPLKGYQYLLPIAPAVAVLAARAVVGVALVPWLRERPRRLARRSVLAVVTLIVVVSLAVPSWALVNPSTTGTFLAGTGGVPGGREAGLWLGRNAPQGAQLLSIGPSMANILQFYGRRRTYGLSVSSNPHDRNPAYTPVANPDRWVRDGRVQYVVWDSYTADRTPFFAGKITALVNRYHGRAVFTATVSVRTPAGARSRNPVVIVYQVWPE